jgi:YgiT-type zinc finger domain-containing protein
MKCPVCGGAELVRDTRDMPYIYIQGRINDHFLGNG